MTWLYILTVWGPTDPTAIYVKNKNQPIVLMREENTKPQCQTGEMVPRGEISHLQTVCMSHKCVY